MKRAPAVAIVLVYACAGDGVSPDAELGARKDAAAIIDAGPGAVIVGTGLDRFEEITPGQTLPLVAGPQMGGAFFGYHIWSAARVIAYPFGVARVKVRFFDAATGERRAILERNEPLLEDGADKVVFGLAPRIDDCCKIELKEIIIEVAIESADGPFAENEVRAIAGACLDAAGAPLCR